MSPSIDTNRRSLQRILLFAIEYTFVRYRVHFCSLLSTLLFAIENTHIQNGAQHFVCVCVFE